MAMFGNGGGSKGPNKIEVKGPPVDYLNLFEHCQVCCVTTETVEKACSRCGTERTPDAESRRTRTNRLVREAKRNAK